MAWVKAGKGVFMLRWLVCGLLLCNFIYFLWGQQASTSSARPANSATIAEGTRLSLLKEKKVDARYVGSGAVTAIGPPTAVCSMIGPFKEKVSARQIKDSPQGSEYRRCDIPAEVARKARLLGASWAHALPARGSRYIARATS